jgi:hypothetical protein
MTTISYVTNMGMLYAMTATKFREFILLGRNGVSTDEALTKCGAVLLSQEVVNATDFSVEDYKLMKLPKRKD